MRRIELASDGSFLKTNIRRRRIESKSRKRKNWKERK